MQHCEKLVLTGCLAQYDWYLMEHDPPPLMRLQTRKSAEMRPMIDFGTQQKKRFMALIWMALCRCSNARLCTARKMVISMLLVGLTTWSVHARFQAMNPSNHAYERLTMPTATSTPKINSIYCSRKVPPNVHGHTSRAGNPWCRGRTAATCGGYFQSQTSFLWKINQS